MQKRPGVLLIEFLIGLTLLLISAGTISMNASLGTPTAKSEAEKLFAKLSNCMIIADNTKTHFQLELESEKIIIHWGAERQEEYKAGHNCSYSWNASGTDAAYSYVTNRFNKGFTITVTGKGDPYYVVIAVIGSRIRVSDTKPSKDT